MSELVTGDAVVLGLRPARLPSRALAAAIDLAVVFFVFILISIVVGIASVTLDEAAVAAITVALFLLVLIGGPIAVETLSHGRSLGKLACGLRVVRDDGGPIRFRHALVRGAMGAVEILMTFGAVACIASLVSARGRRLGDVFAGTLVVRERVAARGSAALPPPPPWLVGRFSQLDLSAVPDELWLAVRQYLTRMHQLDPGVGGSIAGRLADELVARTGIVPPQGIPAAAFLAAVVHERKARDARRAFARVSPVVGPVAVGGSGAPAVSGAPLPTAPSGSPEASAASGSPAFPMPGDGARREAQGPGGVGGSSGGFAPPG
ncbi:RDD family protein [Streptomyces sp. HNA39]|uniref:RDD family protein n=1 Tax=Streptomyces sp. HNA39 TaxID=2850561 RepID=UPI00200FC103|nr:RDD family protein [Streptomyces sp. HNA39]UQA34307.1 RDD family protein [Streptomyces sp. HNA39]